MKKITILAIGLLIAILSFQPRQTKAQTPNGFKYQAVMRDTEGNIIKNEPVEIRIDILQNTESGMSVYSEQHGTTTSVTGLINFNIGEGEVVSGVFNDIDWSIGKFFLQISLSRDGGEFVVLGSVPFLAVPYALHAKTADNTNDADADPTNEIQNLQLNGNILTITKNGSATQIDLSKYLDNTDTQLTEAEVDAMVDNNGYVTDNNLHSVAKSGNYTELNNKPTLEGDATGNLDNNRVEKIQGREVSTNIPASGQVLKWNGSSWVPAQDELGAAGTTDGVVQGVSVSGTQSKTITLSRSSGLSNLTANFTDEVTDADSDASNEIQDLQLINNILTITKNDVATAIDLSPYLEDNSLTEAEVDAYVSNNGYQLATDDADVDSLNEIQNLTIIGDTIHLSKNGGSVALPTKGWGNPIVDEALFAVVNNNGDTVFAVYQGGVRIFVDETATKAKGSRGGFAVGGFTTGKGATNNEYLRVTPDSVRVYVNESPTKATGSRGGFAVGGFTTGKSIPGNEYLRVTPDSVRVYVNESVTKATGSRGGFAVGGFTTGKSIPGNEYLRVTPDSVRVYVNENAIKEKGSRGGFAVGGFTTGKSIPGNEYLRVTPDSVRVYVNENAAKATGSRGGFAVGGFTTGKSIPGNEYLRVTPDSVRVYIDNNPTKATGSRGGFAVGGFTTGKGIIDDYFNISGQTQADIIDPSEPRILWYPNKEAFLAGRVLVESPDSVGLNSWATGFESKSIGDYSQALGYKAKARGNNSTAIGNNAVVDNSNSFALGNNTIVSGLNSYAIGNGAIVTKEGSYAIGSGAEAKGNFSFAFGSSGVDSAGVTTSGTKATADYAYAFGMGSTASNNGAFAIGTQNIASGYFSTAIGYNTISSGYYGSTALGYKTRAIGNYGSTALGYSSVARGDYSTAIGKEAIADNWYSISIGDNTMATGYNATAIGKETTASGNASTAMGNNTMAIGGASTAMGFNSIAKGNSASVAMGFNTIASGGSSTAMGYKTSATGVGATAMSTNTIARSYAETVLGAYNDTTFSLNTTNWEFTDPLFIIGNGTDDSYRLNAFMVLKNGNTGVGGHPGIYGMNVFAIKNGAAPSQSLDGGILLFSANEASSAELKVMDEAGNTTTLSPHNFSLTKKSEPMAWSFYSENKKEGFKINIDMLKAIRTIEELSGEKLVYMKDLKTNEFIDDKSKNSLFDIVEKQKEEISALNNKLDEVQNQNKELTQKVNEIELLKIELEKLKEIILYDKALKAVDGN